MRRVMPLMFATAVLLTACTDETRSPVSPEARKETEFDTGPMGTTKQYWRSSDELWVFESTTELGFSSHLPRYELYQTGINQVRQGGARLMRHDLDWKEVDPGGYGPLPPTNCASCPPLHNELDNFVDNIERALSSGVVPVVVLHGTPEPHQRYGPHNNWQGATDAELTVARQQFTRFVESVMQLVPGVNYWQILNEVDAGHNGVGLLGGGSFQHVGSGLFSFNRNTQGRNYAKLLQAVYPVIKANNPNAWVLTAGMTGAPYMDYQANPVSNAGWDFVHGLYQGGGKRYVDIMAVHAYGRPTGDPTGFTDKGNQLLAVMRQYNDAARPLWLTEFGRGAMGYIAENGTPSANAGPIFDNDQSSFFANALTLLQYGGVFHKALVYTLGASEEAVPPAGVDLPHDGSCGSYPLGGPKQDCEREDYGYGLFRTDLVTPRPAFQTIATHPINQNWLTHGFGYGDITVSTYLRPLGYSYTRNGTLVTIHGVTLNKLYATRIMFAPEDNPDPDPPTCENNEVYC